MNRAETAALAKRAAAADRMSALSDARSARAPTRGERAVGDDASLLGRSL
jgi:hypothetical protein